MNSLHIAHQMVAAFRGNDPRQWQVRSPKGWPVTRKTLADQLTVRLQPGQPNNSPDQGRTSRCGPAAFLYCMIHDRPDLYVKLATDLWLNGVSNLKNGPTGHNFVVKAGHKAITSAANLTPYNISDLDWMTMGCVSKPNGDAEPSQELLAITLPATMRDWFLAVGCRVNVYAFSSTLGTEIFGLIDVSDLQRGLSLFPTNWIVLEIDPKLIAGQRGGLFQRHWVVVNEQFMPTFGALPLGALRSVKKQDDLKHLLINMHLACWGQRDNLIRPNLTIQVFSRDWFGIAAYSRIP